MESIVTPKGVIMANYKRAGEVKTGTIGAKEVTLSTYAAANLLCR